MGGLGAHGFADVLGREIKHQASGLVAKVVELVNQRILARLWRSEESDIDHVRFRRFGRRLHAGVVHCYGIALVEIGNIGLGFETDVEKAGGDGV